MFQSPIKTNEIQIQKHVNSINQYNVFYPTQKPLKLLQLEINPCHSSLKQSQTREHFPLITLTGLNQTCEYTAKVTNKKCEYIPKITLTGIST